jgi:trans-2,3-dihydro-3-hydroxyanthranilate isomerase
MRPLRYVICDVFTDRPLTGNQLAVFTDARGLPDTTMQALAREMNYSESVFVTRPQAGGHARIRIFTPTRELPFAGHPVLGTAFVLGGPLQTETLRLETGQGVIDVVLEREGARIVFGWMTQPIPDVQPVRDAGPVLAALGVADSLLPIEQYNLGPSHLFVALSSRDQVAALRPDLVALARASDAGVNVFCADGERVKTRMFAPGHGVPEDAATGSAAGPLALHLLRHGLLASDQELTIEQGAEIGRPSTLHARVHAPDGRVQRVQVGGRAVIVARGEFIVPLPHAQTPDNTTPS